MSLKATELKNYHHGDLRGALIIAAERLMEEQANWTFTLREVARAAGVSHNAPYNHFADRQALLAAVAARAFDDLSVALETSVAKTRANTETRIRKMACAYVAFAVKNTSRYRLMFSAELAGCEDIEFQRAGNRASELLQRLIKEGISEGTLRDDAEGKHALAAWSLIHGFSTLILDGKVPKPKSLHDLAISTELIAEMLLKGLLVR